MVFREINGPFCERQYFRMRAGLGGRYLMNRWLAVKTKKIRQVTTWRISLYYRIFQKLKYCFALL